MDHYNTISIFHVLLSRTFRFSPVHFFADFKTCPAKPTSATEAEISGNYVILKSVMEHHAACYE
jgi:hypothetical protein